MNISITFSKLNLSNFLVGLYQKFFLQKYKLIMNTSTYTFLKVNDKDYTIVKILLIIIYKNILYFEICLNFF